MGEDRRREEEEARQEAEERRRTNPRAEAEGRRRVREPLFDYEWRGIEETSRERGSRAGRNPQIEHDSPFERSLQTEHSPQAERDAPEPSYREPERASEPSYREPEPAPERAPERTLEQAPERVPGRSRRRGPTREPSSRGLYGSQVGSNMLRAAVAELVGTFILVFAGTAVATAALLQRPTAGSPYDSLAVALSFGLALAAIVAAIGHVSGAHVNPAVTLGLAFTNKFPWEYVPAYVGAQLLGAIFGAVGTWIAYGPAARLDANVAATFPQPGVGSFQTFVVELLVTFVLVFVVISVATDERVPAGVAPLAVGFALALGVFIAGPVTGGAVNPARALGPMIVAWQFTAAWAYVLGPIVGGGLAALLYEHFVSEAEAP